MSTGAVFKLIANDGKADRMIMATKLLNQRIKDVMCARNAAGKADITPKQRAMLDFAMKTAMQPWTVGDADFETLRSHGFSDEDIWDIGGVAAFFALSNRMANLTNMRPNDEFYTMGREKR